uniref:CEP63/Deup1 N-terminal domain-containing protein n=1 Tax=Ciona savignyi TaxID=51511 RepID=H2ZPS0_CIOSA
MDKTIWDCLEKQTEGGTLLTSCGAELQELMRQIDIMVRNKKMEWESELIASQDSLAVRDQELSRARAVLDQKQQEIGVLKDQLESYESGQSSLASQYELQLNNLKSQLRNLKV